MRYDPVSIDRPQRTEPSMGATRIRHLVRVVASASMRQLLACLLLLATGVLPTLGTTHAHTPHGDSIAVVQHTHGIGLAHDHDGPGEHPEDGDPAHGTLNLDSDQLVLAGRIAANAPMSLRGEVGWHARPLANGVSANPMPEGAGRFSITGAPPPKRDHLAIRVTAPRRGPPQPSV